MCEKLLIVDDEPGIVDMMAAYFAPRYRVLTARSGREALEKAGEGPDLILLDINMPGLDGLTVCQTIRASGAVMEHVRKIRAKLAAHTLHSYIDTVWGCGYRWNG